MWWRAHREDLRANTWKTQAEHDTRRFKAAVQSAADDLGQHAWTEYLTPAVQVSDYYTLEPAGVMCAILVCMYVCMYVSAYVDLDVCILQVDRLMCILLFTYHTF